MQVATLLDAVACASGKAAPDPKSLPALDYNVSIYLTLYGHRVQFR
jgi:hypothetical protein